VPRVAFKPDSTKHAKVSPFKRNAKKRHNRLSFLAWIAFGRVSAEPYQQPALATSPSMRCSQTWTYAPSALVSCWALW
jgi:hypothetical protein